MILIIIRVGIGLPVPSTEAKLVDDDDNEAVHLVNWVSFVSKDRRQMLGYWQRPDATDEIIKNGWLHTGDIAVMDEEGSCALSIVHDSGFRFHRLSQRD